LEIPVPYSKQTLIEDRNLNHIERTNLSLNYLFGDGTQVVKQALPHLEGEQGETRHIERIMNTIYET
jgi:hypothetical protein